jgi:serine/threonine protein kinase
MEQGEQSYIEKKKINNQEIIYKKFNSPNFLSNLEVEIWKRISNDFPNPIHFCPIIDYDFEENSISLKEIKYNNKILSLENFLKYERNFKIITNTLLQIFNAIIQIHEKNITHYDLHTSNILIEKTKFDFHIYKVENFYYPIKTYNVCPVIIDFGLSYLENFNYCSSPYWCHQNYTNFYFNKRNDWFTILDHITHDLEKKKSRPFTKLLNRYKKELTPTSDLPDLFSNLEDKIKKINYHGLLRHVDQFIEIINYQILLPIKEYIPIKYSFRQNFFKFYILWFQNVEPKMRNTKNEFLFLKKLVQMDIEPLKVQYPFIKNILKMKFILKDISINLNNLYLNYIDKYMKCEENDFKVKDIFFSEYENQKLKIGTSILFIQTGEKFIIKKETMMNDFLKEHDAAKPDKLSGYSAARNAGHDLWGVRCGETAPYTHRSSTEGVCERL